MRILAVGAHPDDMEISCSGTLAKYSQRGDEVFIAIVTNGEVGSNEIPKNELIKTRRQEAEAAAGIIRAELIWIGYPDHSLFNSEETRRRMIDVFREVEPDVVFTHSPYDYDTDHITTSRLCVDARTMASIKYIETKHKPSKYIPHLYYVDTAGGIGFEPEEFVNISDTISIKKQMLSKHQSQLRFMKQLWNVDLIERLEIIGRYRGLQAGIKYAEAFVNCKIHPRVTHKSRLP